MNNTGLFNEKEVVASLNNKPVCLINKNMQNLLKRIYGVLSPFRIVKCGLTDNYIKPDIWIKYKGMTEYVSIKCGKSHNLHTEKLRTFIAFLRTIGFSEETLKTIVFVHYGDGTYDGSGPVRYTTKELYVKYKNRIDKANKELNADKDKILMVLERAMFQGVDVNANAAGYIYFGDIEYGNVVNRHQIEKYIVSKMKSFSYFENLHVGPLQIYPHARYAHSQVVSETRRNEMQLNWINLQGDLEYIIKRFAY